MHPYSKVIVSCCPPDGRSQLLICNKMELGVMWVIKPMMTLRLLLMDTVRSIDHVRQSRQKCQY
jgi:hypothetical protein